MRGLILAAVLTGFACQIAAQVPPRTQDDIRQADLERRMGNLGLLDKIARQEAEDQRRKSARSTTYRPELTPKFQKTFEVEKKILAKFSDQLRQPGTGIIKLLSESSCAEISRLSALGKCLQKNANIREYANSFSFRELKLNNFAKADLAIGRGFFITGRHSVQTMLVNLGDVALSHATLDVPGIRYLSRFRPGETVAKIDEEYDLFKNGVTVARYGFNGPGKKYSYGKLSKIVKDSTYAIRAIAYRPDGAELLSKDKDVIFVFRTIEVKQEKFVTIMWKELRRSDGMVMKFEDTGKD